MSPLLDAEQAAALLNVPKTWILAQAREDKIPYVPLGRYRRFDQDELEAWWRTQSRGPRKRANA